MGGTFDPVHNGHMAAAQTAFDRLQLDHLRMIPCNIPNHRRPPLCTPQQRLAMLRLATVNLPGISVDPQELERTGISYSIDTVESIKFRHRDHLLFFIMGQDAFNMLASWHRWQDLLELCHIVVISRPASTSNPGAIETRLLSEHQVFSVSELSAIDAGRIFVIDDLNVDISSSRVREMINKDQDVSNLLDPAVADYLESNGLYRVVQKN